MSKDWDTIQPAAQSPLPYSTISELMKTSAMFNGSKTEKPTRRRQNETFKCHVCESYIKAYNFDYYKRSNHAIIHTGLQRYICPVEGCGAKTRHRSNMVVHARTAHGLTGKIEIENCLLPHEEDELKRTVILCFPEMTNTVLRPPMKNKYSETHNKTVKLDLNTSKNVYNLNIHILLLSEINARCGRENNGGRSLAPTEITLLYFSNYCTRL
ncbi:Protein CBG04083 [Caenorhabditis briggsae]|uniref:Protein CBG04083 n=1 Tax=Caenorhabditis briggsae TaxID=6238 RepID=A8WW63_CAEBR|nr:Protein CBG04083 [Caenorhabditis briggsae]CAP24872.2 Protein CBG04083 [Caenorhabditis briggsae]